MSATLGIDLSTFVVDIVRLDESSNHADWLRVDLAGPDAIARLRSLRELMPGSSFFDDVYLAAIESPMGRGEGGTQAKLNRVWGAVASWAPSRVALWEVAPHEWRKELGLPGNAKKDVARARVAELWVDAPADAPQDAFDAYAVAYFAREVNARGIAA